MDTLLILFEIVLFAECGFGLFVLMGEEGLEARAEIDVPAPEAAEGRLGVLVVVCAELAVLAGVGLLCHKAIRFLFHSNVITQVFRV